MLERPLGTKSVKILHRWVMKNDPKASEGILSEGAIEGSINRAMGRYYGERQ